MNRLLIIITFFLLISIKGYTHKDRPVEWVSILLIFTENDTISISQTDEIDYNEHIELKKNSNKILEEAIVKFETGENLIFKFTNSVLTSLQVKHKRQSITVPKEVVEKISLAQIDTILLVWYGDSKIPFDSKKYFYFRFINAKDKEINEFQVIRLKFSNKKFSDASFGDWKKNENKE